MLPFTKCAGVLVTFVSLTATVMTGEPARVKVAAAFRNVNGVTEVPRGLFGVHATPLTPEMIQDWGIESVRIIEQKPNGNPVVPGQNSNVPAGIGMVVECFYDRYQPARMLTDPDWKKNLTELASTYGQNAKESGRKHVIEFWNEPYLNWAKKPGVNYDGTFYEPGNEGEPMRIKGWEQPLDSLVWSKQLVAVEETTGKVDYLASSYALPLVWNGKLKEGDEYVFRETKKLRIESRPWGKDPGQTSWFSGPQNSQLYRWMFLPFAKALKEANPEVQLVAGWGFHISQDNWVAWPVLFKPLIDESIQWLDGLNEHHYGGDTRMVAGSYEVVQAYAKTTHGKLLKFYNTEAGGLLDPERPDALGQPHWSGDTIEAQRAAATYMLRDVLHLIDTCPDKAVARAAHDAKANYGVELAFKLLKDLRGDLLRVETDIPQMTAVASVEGKRMCVVLFNDSSENRSVPLTVLAPGNTGFRKGEYAMIETAEKLRLISEPVSVKGKIYNASSVLPPKGAMRWTFELTEAVVPNTVPTIFEQQHFAPGILTRVTQAQPASLEVQIAEVDLAKAKSAQLKFVFQDWSSNTRFFLNGTEIKLDVRNTWTHTQSVDPALLKASNHLTFETTSERPVTIGMASIITATEPL